MTLSPWKAHVAKWEDCLACELCSQRSRVVLGRGKLPCDVLFVGEAPGQSEDVIGVPFIGPAGKLQDQLIREALTEWPDLRLFFTNLVACFPREAKREGINEPSATAIKACRVRLVEAVRMAEPKLLVLVGALADKNFAWDCPKVALVHPAAILRANIAQRGLMEQRYVVLLRNAVARVVRGNHSDVAQGAGTCD